ncbi:glycosyltransferase family 4 protein [Pedobacter aquae]|uniref:Glycosyltransferase family 4 protein n=1 Tax=Pedobacter aquae TaxID=2605747 RepID=A0A5C0VD59_9SPHI|nr:glycosyltransferase family 4 protein [Pedobacter aquae]QEK50326.1 glycosyltransferase family 4 protein [Pedobacter aquae]
MRIAISADPFIPVPPINYGGIERIVELLINEYTNLGHTVVLFAHKESKVKCKLMPYPCEGLDKISTLRNTLFISRNIIFGQYDILHSFSRLAYLTFLLPLSIPKIMSYQREPTLSQVKLAQKLAQKNTLLFTGCSNYISKKIAPIAKTSTIYNGVLLDKYTFKPKIGVDAPLIFLGRIEPIKGTHIAIKVAIACRKKLVIAGNIPDNYQNYYRNEIKPFLNEDITYIGPVNDVEKNELLGNALAFLMPIEWNEPFGIVMAEAMACGTPVVAFKRGSVPEVVIDGENGFACDNLEDMICTIKKVANLDRRKVRNSVEKRFSSEVISRQYLSIYKKFNNEM